VETIGSKRSYALIWCMPNNDDDACVGSASIPSSWQGAVAALGTGTCDQVYIKLWTWSVGGKSLILGV